MLDKVSTLASGHYVFIVLWFNIHVIVSRQLEPDNYTDLILDEAQSSFYEELWDGEKVKYIILTSSTTFEQFIQSNGITSCLTSSTTTFVLAFFHMS